MIDDTDIRILEELKDDGRASYSDISDKLGLATSTVAGRIQKMEDKDIIQGFRPVIDYEKLGFTLTAMINIQARSEKVEDIASKLKSRDRVISFFEVTGKTDMIIITRFTDRESMNSFLKLLQKEEGVKSTETRVILTTPKLEDNMDIGEISNKERLA